ncbi:MAG: hypothetical protein U0R17_03460 [Acidimicrobiia bacterium]
MRRIAKVLRTNFLIAIIALLTFVTTLSYLQSLDKKIYAATIRRNVNQGQKITSNDIEFKNVSSDEIINQNIVTKKQFSENSYVAKIDLTKSNLLTTSTISKVAKNNKLQSLSIGVDLDRANGGNISRGDKVDIYKTGEEAKLITSYVSVRDVISPNKRLGVSTSTKITIVIAVTRSQAQALSQVIGTQDLMIVISNGVSSQSDINQNDNPTNFEAVELYKDQ